MFMGTHFSAFIVQLLPVASLIINMGYSFRPCSLVSYSSLTHRHFYSHVSQINLNMYVTNVHIVGSLNPGPCKLRDVSPGS